MEIKDFRLGSVSPSHRSIGGPLNRCFGIAWAGSEPGQCRSLTGDLLLVLIGRPIGYRANSAAQGLFAKLARKSIDKRSTYLDKQLSNLLGTTASQNSQSTRRWKSFVDVGKKIFTLLRAQCRESCNPAQW